MTLLESVLFLLLENFISFGLHSLLHPGACCVMGSEEVAVEQEPILTARSAAVPSQCRKDLWLLGFVWLAAVSPRTVPVVLCAEWLGMEWEARSPGGEGT